MGLLLVPSPSGEGLEWGRPQVKTKADRREEITLTPAPSLEGEGELRNYLKINWPS